MFWGSEGYVRVQGLKSRGLGGCLGTDSDHAGRFGVEWEGVWGGFGGVFLRVVGGTGWVYGVGWWVLGVGGLR